MGNTFKEEDKEKVIQFLNMVATYAEFNKMSVNKLIDFFKLLNFMQVELLPKIEDNILEIKKVIKPDTKDDF